MRALINLLQAGSTIYLDCLCVPLQGFNIFIRKNYRLCVNFK